MIFRNDSTPLLPVEREVAPQQIHKRNVSYEPKSNNSEWFCTARSFTALLNAMLALRGRAIVCF